MPKIALLLSCAVLAATLVCASDAQPNPGTQQVNIWTPLGDGTYPPPKGNWPSLTGPAFLWLADRDFGVVAPMLTETEAKEGPGLRKISFESPKWEFVPGKTPATPDTFDSPKGYVYLPGLKKILLLKQEWWWSSKKQPTAGWLLDPESAVWEPLLSPLSMSETFEDFNPAAKAMLPVPVGEAANKAGKRLPVWGVLCYDAHNKEAVSFGGGGVWGRMSADKEPVKAGDWIFDEAAKRVRRLTPDDSGVTSARRWYPSHCGTWTFSESTKTWKAIEQPLGRQPSARILPGMAYDSDAKKIVLFGGDDLARCVGDTWVYDCASRTWSEVKPPVSPQARAGHALVYVPSQKAMLLAGGYGGNWTPLKDAWAFSTAKGEWTKLGLDLPAPAAHASADFDPKRGLVVMAAYPNPARNGKMPVFTLKLDVASAPKAPAEAARDPKLDYHCKGKGWGSKLPDEYLAGDLAAKDPKAGLAAVAAQPANTWVLRKPPWVPPGRDWGSNVYDPRTHRAYAWGGGHSTYPGADVIEYDVGMDRWVGMADAPNYNPVWLHGMVSGPPGISAGGWSLLPTHSRKSYGIDVASNSLITYIGDVYDLKHRMFVTNIGVCPGKYGVASQVSFCSTPHGLYAYSTGTLAKASVAAGKWEEVVSGSGPKHDEHGHLCHDTKRDRLVYFARDTGEVWCFDFKVKQWAQEQLQGKPLVKAHGDSTYIPELDAALLVCTQDKAAPEQLYFYKLAERKWYTTPSTGDKFQFPNAAGRDFSPIYDPELKAVVRIKNCSRMEVAVLRLDPATLTLTPLE